MSGDGIKIDFHGDLSVYYAPCDRSHDPGCVFLPELHTRRRGASYETSSKRMRVQSADAFTALGWPPSIGPQSFAGTLLYLRALDGVSWVVQVTYQTGDPVEIPVHSLLLLEAPEGNLITGVAVMGQGTIEYLVAGEAVS